MTLPKNLAIVATFLLSASFANAAVLYLNFDGNAGAGLLPGNEIGASTATTGTSTASGGESGGGMTYDTSTNLLSVNFSFTGLTGGLNAIHIHSASSATDPFNTTGGVAFNLNSGSDPNVTLLTPTVPGGSAGGTLGAQMTLTPAQEAQLFAGQLYVNIHSGGFGGGELRGSIVIPEPSRALLLGLAGAPLLLRRRRSARHW